MPTSSLHRPSRRSLRPTWSAGRAPAALVVPAALFAATALLTPTALPAAAAPVGPQLSIAVDNGHARAKAGDRLTYAITVSNLGSKRLDRLMVSATVPAGSSFVSADARGRHHADHVTWAVRVPPARHATVHTTLSVARRTPKELLRLATVACAQVTVKGPPVVCAADSDQLPAGAAAETAARATEPSSAEKDGPRVVAYVGAGVGACCLVAAALALVLRRRAAG